MRVKVSSMTRNSDISTPQGYFDSLQQRLQAIPGKQQAARPSAARRLVPYMAYAASLALLVAVGGFILRKTVASPQEEVYEGSYYSYLAQSLDPDGGLVDLPRDYSLSEEDIVQYLVDEGVSLDYLNVTNYEKAH